MLAWALIGYANLFDFGLGRALTQLVARKLGAGKEPEISPIAWGSLLLMLVLGLVGGIVVALFSPWLVYHTLRIPAALQVETLRSFRLLGFSVPIVITTAGLRGLLEAYQRFGLINLLRIPMGVFAFAGPLLILPFSKSVFAVVALLVLGRVFAWVAHFWLCFHVIPSLRSAPRWWHTDVLSLLRFGGWMTVTNVIGPLMVIFDRFLLGALLSITAVAYYTTPYEIVTKVWIVPSAIIGVMFPAFSTSFVQNQKRTGLLFVRTVRIIFLAIFPVTLLIVAFASEGLNLWLGADFGSRSARVLQWLAAGVFVNSLALVPFTFIQSVGRPDITAKLHLLELPFYLFLLWWLVRVWGIEGAAIAWTIRIVLDAVVLFLLAGRFLTVPASQRMRALLPIMVALLIFAISGVLPGILSRVIFLSCTYLIYGAASWFHILSLEERTLVLSYLKQVQASN